MGRRRNPAALWCKTTLTLAFIRATASVPLPVARVFGRYFGRLAYYIVPRVHSVGKKNIQLAYGDSISAKEKKALLLESMENLGILACEFGHLPLMYSEKRDQLIDVKGIEHIQDSEGGVLMSAHFGNWEWMIGALSVLDLRRVVVARPLRDPRLNDAIKQIRCGSDMEIIGKKNVGAEIIKSVRDGNLVGLMVDQSTRKNGVPVTFFGQKCWATVGPIMVALRTKAPIYPITMLRNESGKYTLEFYPPITIERTKNIHQDLINGSQLCQDLIEAIIRKNPGQWMWIHDRWKAQPRLEKEWEKRLSQT